MSTWRPSEEIHESRFHIDSGPVRNALQVISEALDIPQQQEQEHDEDSNVSYIDNSPPGSDATTQHLLSEPPTRDHSPYNINAAQAGGNTTKTIVASDADVSNGFVKSGRSLPYVFEASESGIRKRSSKILPVCAVCEKRFVCVTTMKRHLVTHTGEKPFSCKVCGKQYTQKGNLRVHERTHRNDRPFECHVCHQKFYRKEPMQKHQWRQHGIIHHKTRPIDGAPQLSSTPTPEHQLQQPSQQQQPQIVIQPQLLSQPQKVPSTSLPPPPPPTPLSLIEPPKPLITSRPAKPSSYTALVDSLRIVSDALEGYRSDKFEDFRSDKPRPPTFAPPAAHQTQIDVPKFTPTPVTPASLQPMTPPLQQSRSSAPQQAVALIKLPLQPADQIEFKHAKCSSNSGSVVAREPQLSSEETSYISPSGSSLSGGSPPSLSSNASSTPPVTMAAPPNLPSTPVNVNNESAVSIMNHQPESAAANFSYSSILNETPNESPNTHLLIVPSATTIEPSSATSQSNSTSEHHPKKLKMKMAYQAYQEQEQQEQQQSQLLEHEQQQVEHQEVVHNLDNDLNEMKIGPNEMVECQCKTCGNTSSVVDPYNFRCNNCNVKYTSLPTHLIADPLQCIGCCAVFPHKPALKAHQTVSDKERPFRCCKCGYGFRQKAHLQKHQWRIHRRKLEPDPSMKEAEAFFESIRSTTSNSSSASSNPSPTGTPQGSGSKTSTTITMQDIINKSVEKSLNEGPIKLFKTSSKYYSEVLGLEYDPKSSTSSDDDDSRDQPLDLSPAKKLASRENNPLLNQPPLPIQPPTPSLTIQPTLTGVRTPSTTINPVRELVEQPTTASTIQDEYPGSWKKQKTSSPSVTTVVRTPAVASSIATHSTLPPISGLQKPMSLVTVKNHFKHSSWITSGNNPNSMTQKEPIELIGGQSCTPTENDSFVRSC